MSNVMCLSQHPYNVYFMMLLHLHIYTCSYVCASNLHTTLYVITLAMCCVVTSTVLMIYVTTTIYLKAMVTSDTFMNCGD